MMTFAYLKRQPGDFAQPRVQPAAYGVDVAVKVELDTFR